jgi:hypothetical protein
MAVSEVYPEFLFSYGTLQLEAVIAQYGLPAAGAEDPYEGYAHRPFERYIEVQVWSDEPIRSLLVTRGHCSA